jgi:UDP-GlcNAc:undecaprenyl-phosphate GlcNAc-1-phosphate transferase
MPSNKLVKYSFLTFFPIIIATAFLALNFNYLPYKIGLWFSYPFGEKQLADPKYLFVIPALSMIFGTINLLFFEYLSRHANRFLAKVIGITSIIQAFGFSLILYSLVLRSSHKFFLENEPLLDLILPLVLSFIVTILLTPKVIKFATNKKIVDDPSSHHHPAQLLTTPTPRGGALAFFLGFVICSFLFLPVSKSIVGIFLGSFVLVILGLIDDRYKYLDPKMRLAVQFIASFIVVGAGVGISYIGNPFGEIIRLDKVVLPFNFMGTHSIVVFADIFAVFWIVFLANAVSWSNGIDGQFSGFAGICFLVIALVSAKTAIGDNDPTQMKVAVLGAIASGSAFGLTPSTWHPQKILWGFGATAVGLIIGALSILSLAKVYIVSMVLIIPLIDAIVTGVRRLLQKKSPFWGDRGHLHHRLLDMGWSKSRISIFYWVITAIFGAVAVFSNENDIDLDVVRFGAVATLIIVGINLAGEWKKLRKTPTE